MANQKYTVDFEVDDKGTLKIIEKGAEGFDKLGKRAKGAGEEMGRQERSAQTLGNRIVTLNQAVQLAATSFNALAGAMRLAQGGAEALFSGISRLDRIDEISTRTGIAVEQLSQLDIVARTAGVGLDGIGRAAQVMSRQMLAAQQGSATAIDAFQQLGIEVRKGQTEFLNFTEVFPILAERFSEMEDGSKKVGLAMTVMGRSGAEMLSVFNLGKDTIQEFIDINRDLGLETTRVYTSMADAIDNNMVIVKAAFDGVTSKMAEGMAPALNEITDALVKVTREMASGGETYKAWGEGLGEAMMAVTATIVKNVGDAFYYLREEGWQGFLRDLKAGSQETLKDAFSYMGEVAADSFIERFIDRITPALPAPGQGPAPFGAPNPMFPFLNPPVPPAAGQGGPSFGPQMIPYSGYGSGGFGPQTVPYGGYGGFAPQTIPYYGGQGFGVAPVPYSPGPAGAPAPQQVASSGNPTLSYGTLLAGPLDLLGSIFSPSSAHAADLPVARAALPAVRSYGQGAAALLPQPITNLFQQAHGVDVSGVPVYSSVDVHLDPLAQSIYSGERQFATITPENPLGRVMYPARPRGAYTPPPAIFNQYLQSLGYNVLPTVGSYGGLEAGGLVHAAPGEALDLRQLNEIAARAMQESIAVYTPQVAPSGSQVPPGFGFLYSHRTPDTLPYGHTPGDFTYTNTNPLYFPSAVPEDYFTSVLTPSGRPLNLTGSIDFDASSNLGWPSFGRTAGEPVGGGFGIGRRILGGAAALGGISLLAPDDAEAISLPRSALGAAYGGPLATVRGINFAQAAARAISGTDAPSLGGALAQVQHQYLHGNRWEMGKKGYLPEVIASRGPIEHVDIRRLLTGPDFDVRFGGESVDPWQLFNAFETVYSDFSASAYEVPQIAQMAHKFLQQGAIRQDVNLTSSRNFDPLNLGAYHTLMQGSSFGDWKRFLVDDYLYTTTDLEGLEGIMGSGKWLPNYFDGLNGREIPWFAEPADTWPLTNFLYKRTGRSDDRAGFRAFQNHDNLGNNTLYRSFFSDLGPQLEFNNIFGGESPQLLRVHKGFFRGLGDFLNVDPIATMEAGYAYQAMQGMDMDRTYRPMLNALGLINSDIRGILSQPENLGAPRTLGEVGNYRGPFTESNDRNFRLYMRMAQPLNLLRHDVEHTNRFLERIGMGGADRVDALLGFAGHPDSPQMPGVFSVFGGEFDPLSTKGGSLRGSAAPFLAALGLGSAAALLPDEAEAAGKPPLGLRPRDLIAAAKDYPLFNAHRRFLLPHEKETIINRRALTAIEGRLGDLAPRAISNQIAQFGMPGSQWYEQSSAVIGQLFTLPGLGESAPVGGTMAHRSPEGILTFDDMSLAGPMFEDYLRYIMVLAAQSPRTGVEPNQVNSSHFWNNWLGADRPLSGQEVFHLMARSVQSQGGLPARSALYNSKTGQPTPLRNTLARFGVSDDEFLATPGGGSMLESWLSGTHRAVNMDMEQLLAPFPLIGGALGKANKVGSFGGNLRLIYPEDKLLYTGDTHEAIGSWIQQSVLGNMHGYTATSLMGRRGASDLGIEPLQYQASKWNVTRAAREILGRKRGGTADDVVEAFLSGELAEQVMNPLNFASLFANSSVDYPHTGWSEQLDKLQAFVPLGTPQSSFSPQEVRRFKRWATGLEKAEDLKRKLAAEAKARRGGAAGIATGGALGLLAMSPADSFAQTQYADAAMGRNQAFWDARTAAAQEYAGDITGYEDPETLNAITTLMGQLTLGGLSVGLGGVAGSVIGGLGGLARGTQTAVNVGSLLGGVLGRFGGGYGFHQAAFGDETGNPFYGPTSSGVAAAAMAPLRYSLAGTLLGGIGYDLYQGYQKQRSLQQAAQFMPPYMVQRALNRASDLRAQDRVHQSLFDRGAMSMDMSYEDPFEIAVAGGGQSMADPRHLAYLENERLVEEANETLRAANEQLRQELSAPGLNDQQLADALSRYKETNDAVGFASVAFIDAGTDVSNLSEEVQDAINNLRETQAVGVDDMRYWAATIDEVGAETLRPHEKAVLEISKGYIELSERAREGGLSVGESGNSLLEAGEAGQQYAAQLDQVSQKTEQLSRNTLNLANVFEVAIGQSLDAVINGTRSLGDVWKGAGLSLIRQIAAPAAGNIADTVLGGLSEAFGYVANRQGIFAGGGGPSGASEPGSLMGIVESVFGGIGSGADWIRDTFSSERTVYGPNFSGIRDAAGNLTASSFDLPEDAEFDPNFKGEGLGTAPGRGYEIGRDVLGGAIAGYGMGQTITAMGLAPTHGVKTGNLALTTGGLNKDLADFNEAMSAIAGAAFGAFLGPELGGLVGSGVSTLIGATHGKRINRAALERGYLDMGKSNVFRDPAATAMMNAFVMKGKTLGQRRREGIRDFVMDPEDGIGLGGLNLIGGAGYDASLDAGIYETYTRYKQNPIWMQFFGANPVSNQVQTYVGRADEVRGAATASDRRLANALGRTFGSQMFYDEAEPEDARWGGSDFGLMMMDAITQARKAGLERGLSAEEIDQMVAGEVRRFYDAAGIGIGGAFDALNLGLEEGRTALRRGHTFYDTAKDRNIGDKTAYYKDVVAERYQITDDGLLEYYNPSLGRNQYLTPEQALRRGIVQNDEVQFAEGTRDSILGENARASLDLIQSLPAVFGDQMPRGMDPYAIAMLAARRQGGARYIQAGSAQSYLGAYRMTRGGSEADQLANLRAMDAAEIQISGADMDDTVARLNQATGALMPLVQTIFAFGDADKAAEGVAQAFGETLIDHVNEKFTDKTFESGLALTLAPMQDVLDGLDDIDINNAEERQKLMSDFGLAAEGSKNAMAEFIPMIKEMALVNAEINDTIAVSLGLLTQDEATLNKVLRAEYATGKSRDNVDRRARNFLSDTAWGRENRGEYLMLINQHGKEAADALMGAYELHGREAVGDYLETEGGRQDANLRSRLNEQRFYHGSSAISSSLFDSLRDATVAAIATGADEVATEGVWDSLGDTLKAGVISSVVTGMLEAAQMDDMIEQFTIDLTEAFADKALSQQEKTELTGAWAAILAIPEDVRDQLSQLGIDLNELFPSPDEAPLRRYNRELQNTVDLGRQLSDQWAKTTMPLASAALGISGRRGLASIESYLPAVPMAEGGIVTKPTFALIGEAGPEAVIPLSRATSVGDADTASELRATRIAIERLASAIEEQPAKVDVTMDRQVLMTAMTKAGRLAQKAGRRIGID